jgi:hypothetical protein
MVAFRAHFDGKVIVPDEPVNLSSKSRTFIVLDVDEEMTAAQIEQATRDYYLTQSPEEKAEDIAWGNATAKDQSKIWDED